jgi:hypothetical protein
MSAYCSYCGKDHPIALCPHTYGGSSARVNLRCTYCGSNQHSIEYCRKTAGGEANRRHNPSGTFLD